MADETGKTVMIMPFTDEQITAAIVEDVAKAVFDPSGDQGISKRHIILTCAALDRFLQHAMALPSGTFRDWREAIGELRLSLGDGDVDERKHR